MKKLLKQNIERVLDGWKGNHLEIRKMYRELIYLYLFIYLS